MKLSIFLFSFALSLQAFARSVNNFDIIYQNNVSALYDQSAVIESERYKKATQQERKVLLETEFLERRNQAYRQHVTGMAEWLAPAVATATAIPLASWLVGRFRGRPAQVPAQAAVGPQGPGLAGNFLFSSLLSTLIQPIIWAQIQPWVENAVGFTTAFTRWVKGDKAHASHDKLAQLELNYVREKPGIDPRMQKTIENTFQEERSTFVPFFGQGGGYAPSLDNTKFIEQVLQLPTELRPARYDATRIEKILESYRHMHSKEAVDQVRFFCKTFVRMAEKKKPQLKTPLYFYGNPGTGKTELVNQIAEVLDAPLIKINLADIQNVSDLKGSKFNPMNPQNSGGAMGILAEKLADLRKMGRSGKNVILFLDEADRIFNKESKDFTPFLLELLEAKTQSIELPYFGGDLDIRYWSVILACNSLPKEEAILNRVEVVQFGGYSLDYWKNITRTRFLNEAIERYDGLILAADFIEDDFAVLEAMAVDEHGEMELGKELETDPGFRNIQRRVNGFVDKKFKAMGNTTWDRI